MWFGGCARFDFTVTDSITYSILTDMLAHRWVHLSFLSIYYEHFPSLITDNGHESRQCRFATLPLVLHWNTKRGLV